MSNKISFVIPTYNCVTFLPHAVKSALKQTHENTEIVIVNDASTDKTKQYLEWLSGNEKKVVVINNEKNMGRSESRNIGNRAAVGKFICVLDADDVSDERRAELSVSKLKTYDFIHGGAMHIDVCGRKLGYMVTEVFNKIKAIEKLETHIVHSTVAYRKEFALKYPYSSGKIAELGIDDWDQQMQAARDGVKFEFIPHILSYYRWRSEGISKTRNDDEVKKMKMEILGRIPIGAN